MMNKDMPKFMVLAYVDDEINPPRFDASFFYKYEDALNAVKEWDDCTTPADIYFYVETRTGYRFVVLDDLIGTIVDRFVKEV